MLALTPLRWDHASRNRVTKRSDGEVQSRKRVAPESGAFGPRFIMLIKDRARRDRMRRLSADSVVSRRDHAGPAQRLAVGGGERTTAGDGWRCRRAAESRRLRPSERRSAAAAAAAGSSSVFINIVLCYACRVRVRNARRSSTDTLRRVPAGRASRRARPYVVSPADKRREGAPRKTRSRRNFLAPRYARV